jgi:hypothetical protein
MGMFDYIYYKGEEYQTKDTPKQFCDKYKIEADQDSGHECLWTELFDSEWVTDENHLLGAYMKTWNHHWVKDEYTGNIVFYRNVDKTYKKWNQYNAIFENGLLREITKWEGEEYE